MKALLQLINASSMSVTSKGIQFTGLLAFVTLLILLILGTVIANGALDV